MKFQDIFLNNLFAIFTEKLAKIIEKLQNLSTLNN